MKYADRVKRHKEDEGQKERERDRERQRAGEGGTKAADEKHAVNVETLEVKYIHLQK